MHSERKTELFDEVFLHVNARFLATLSPLLILSVAATVSEGLGVHIEERLHWLDMCLQAMGADVSSKPSLDATATEQVLQNHEELRDVLLNVLDVILQRIQQCYMQVSQVNFQDPVLKAMHKVARQISDLKARLES
jgi:hypothetical protein